MNIETIIVGPIQVNCYIITCPTTLQSAIIDPGDDADDILNIVQSKSLKVKYILLTHGHFDHIGAVAPVKHVTNAEIVMHQADDYLIQSAALQARAFGLNAPITFTIDRYTNEGDEIQVGRLKAFVISTPGHTPGCVCYKFDDVIFVGDTLFYGGIGRTDLPGGNYNHIIQSIKTKLYDLPDQIKVYCGHGPATSIGREKLYNPFVH